MTTSGVDAQTFLPHPLVNGVEVDENATANFSTTGNFGFVVDGYEYSDDSHDPAAGHQCRRHRLRARRGPRAGFYPRAAFNRETRPQHLPRLPRLQRHPRSERRLPDGVWIVSGIRPAGIRENNPPAGVAQFATAPAPVDVHAVPAAGGGVTLQWAQVSSYTSAVGCDVLRLHEPERPVHALNSTPLTSVGYTDITAAAGKVNYYRVTEVDPTTGVESPGAGTAFLVAPAVPAGLSAVPTSTGVALTWTANTETDLAGYNVYRSLYPTEGFTLLNTNGLLTSPAFNDTTAPGGATSYYLVTAVDTSGNECAFGDQRRRRFRCEHRRAVARQQPHHHRQPLGCHPHVAGRDRRCRVQHQHRLRRPRGPDREVPEGAHTQDPGFYEQDYFTAGTDYAVFETRFGRVVS